MFDPHGLRMLWSKGRKAALQLLGMQAYLKALLDQLNLVYEAIQSFRHSLDWSVAISGLDLYSSTLRE